MKIPSIKQEPDWSFQEDAINAIVDAYEKDPTAKNLLVIPTGGGKTITALRAVSRLLDLFLIDKHSKVLWTVHRKILEKQVLDVLGNKDYYDKFKLNKNLAQVVEVKMKVAARQALEDDASDKYKLLIIDEAHHSAANTYKDFFSQNFGILGLTATPSRNDDSQLDFDRIVYSIVFGDLVKRGVIIEPEFINYETNIRISDLDTLDTNNKDDNRTINSAFNTESRNKSIAKYLLTKDKIFKKVVIFVSSNDHVESLYKTLVTQNMLFGNNYHIGYIYGEPRKGKSNDKGLSNNEYLKWHKQFPEPSILVNCQMLNEGYDDPLLDTIVMAVPTNSLLYYMQCIGRVVRNPQDTGANSQAFVVECVDELPNFVYRIDNKWLYADISDFLEPKVFEARYESESQLNDYLKKQYDQHNVAKKYRKYPSELREGEKISLLLLHPTKSDAYKEWIPLLMTDKTRTLYTRAYNLVSNNIKSLQDVNYDYLIYNKLKMPKDDIYFGHSGFISDFMATLKYSFEEKQNRKEVKRIHYFNFIKQNNPTFFDKIMKLLKQVGRILNIFKQKHK